MNSYGQDGPKYSDSCPYKKSRGHRETHRHPQRRRTLESEAGIGGKQPQVKKRLRPPELEEAWPCGQLDVGLTASRTVEE